MIKHGIIFTSFDLHADAVKIAEAIVKNKLGACVQITTSESYYIWKEQLTNSKEFILSIKTTKTKYPQVEKYLLDNHPYDNPEIIFTPIELGSEKYLSWIDSAVKE